MRLLSRPLLVYGLALAAFVAGVAAVAGGVRALPLILAAGVPASVGAAFGRGVLSMSLEVGLFVASPIAGAVVAARCVERGEAAALAALGVRPLRLVASAWPGAIALAGLCALASATWGREAAAPGLSVTRLLDDARAACVADVTADSPVAVEVPLADAAWLCFPGEPPRAVLHAALGSGQGARVALTARDLRPSEDLRTLRAIDAQLVVEGEGQRATLGADDATIRGLVPLGHASNLSAPVRAALLALTSLALGFAAMLAVIGAAIGSRARAAGLGVATAVAALLVYSTLERAPAPLFAYAWVPLAGLAACAVTAWMSSRVRIARRER